MDVPIELLATSPYIDDLDPNRDAGNNFQIWDGLFGMVGNNVTDFENFIRGD